MISFPDFIDDFGVDGNFGERFQQLAGRLKDVKDDSELSDLLLDLGQAVFLCGDGRVLW